MALIVLLLTPIAFALAQIGSSAMLMLLAGIHVASLAAGTFSIVTALSLYRRPERRKVTEHFFGALQLRLPLGILTITVRRHGPNILPGEAPTAVHLSQVCSQEICPRERFQPVNALAGSMDAQRELGEGSVAAMALPVFDLDVIAGLGMAGAA